jgi:phosphorylcholine metabolism protein LicD
MLAAHKNFDITLKHNTFLDVFILNYVPDEVPGDGSISFYSSSRCWSTPVYRIFFQFFKLINWRDSHWWLYCKMQNLEFPRKCRTFHESEVSSDQINKLNMNNILQPSLFNCLINIQK